MPAAGQSFGRSRLFGYLELSQRPSFWADCFLFIFDLSLSIAMVSVEDMLLPDEECELFIGPAETLEVPLAPTPALGLEVLWLLVEGVIEEVLGAVGADDGVV